jgi:pyridoxine/pyridoxamine 5'-phosphate oxidase
MSEPELSRPFAPGYGLPTDPPDPAKVSWERAQEQLTAARNYWITTCSQDGRPHAMPVWGVWFEGALIFGTGRSSRKGRDLAARPDVVVHLESGDDAVIIEGVVEPVTDAALLSRYVDAFASKYNVRIDGSDSDSENIYYRLREQKAFTWLEADFLETAARWTFAVST